MTKTSFHDLPEWIQARILESLDFEVCLKARAVCRRWNLFINQLLAPSTILNIRFDDSIQSRKFRHGKWNSSLVIPYQEIRLVPKPVNAFIYGKAKNKYICSLKDLDKVKKFTLYENGSFLHFVHRYTPLLSRVKYIQVRELEFDKDKDSAFDSKYTYLGHVYTCAVKHLKSWSKSQENLSQVETLRLRLFDRLAMLIYIQAFTFRICNLVNVELDFSKLSGAPLPRYFLNELNGAICDLLEHCYLSLRQLRLKWTVRVSTDIDFGRADEDIDPYFEFLLSLRNPIWKKLRLELLFLCFPTVNLALNLSETNLFPVLEKIAVKATRINLSRVMPNAGLESFMRSMPSNALSKFEFHFYFMDAELFPQPVPLIRGIEVVFENSRVPIDQTLIASLSRMRLNGSKNYQSLKFINGRGNEGFRKPNMFVFTEYFPNLKNVELLDSNRSPALVRFTTDDFNLIVRKLTKLCCLRMSNVALEDADVCGIPEAEMNAMKRIGVFHKPNHKGAPVAGARELRFLDLRDLSPTLTDFSVYFAFQHIKKLEKISFHGRHCVTDWGKRLLERKKGKNPSFGVILKAPDESQVMLGNYSNPCADFP